MRAKRVRQLKKQYKGMTTGELMDINAKHVRKWSRGDIQSSVLSFKGLKKLYTRGKL
jgi:hypothetical protein